MDDLRELFEKLKTKIQTMGEEDYFPLMKRYNTDNVRELCIMVGIYLAAIILCVIIIFALGWIPVLGIIMKIASAIVIIYSTIGMFAALLNFLKYN